MIDTCIGCQKCVLSCPADVLELDPRTKKVIPIHQQSCRECRACEVICSKHAIYVD